MPQESINRAGLWKKERRKRAGDRESTQKNVKEQQNKIVVGNDLPADRLRARNEEVGEKEKEGEPQHRNGIDRQEHLMSVSVGVIMDLSLLGSSIRSAQFYTHQGGIVEKLK